MTAVIEPVTIRFEGFTAGTEIWGGTQANFFIQLPGQHARETAILLNTPAAKALAEAAGRDDTEEFRQLAARTVGEALLPQLVRQAQAIEPIIMVSRGYLQDRPDMHEAVVAALRS